MNLVSLSAKNAGRNKVRTGLTIAGVAVAILAFVLLRTVIWSWTVGADVAAKDRIGTRHKITFVMTLPKKYIDDIRQVPGVKQATWANWFGGKDPNHPTEFFATIATDAPTFLEVYDEIQVPEDQKQAWLNDRKGAIVGDVLAKKLGWKVGQKVVLQGTIYPGDWEFTIDGIYTATRKSVDRSTFWFHWNYMNDSTTLAARQKDQIGWIVSRIDDPKQSAAVSKAIDQKFDERDTQTLTMSERDLQTSFLGMFSAVLKAVNIVSIVILAIMALILGNTIAMGARERTAEYGVMRAIGFLPRHVGLYVMVEGIVIGLAGGLVGLGLAYPFITKGLGKYIEENMGGMFPYFRVAPSIAWTALALSVLIGVSASVIPAWRASKLHVVDALRRVG